MNTLIEVKNLFFKYGDQYILENASLDISRGDYLGLIGSNGSAKTTLLKLILGILRPSKGKIYIFGEEINNFNKWEKIGYLPQRATSFNKSFPATVEEVLEVTLKTFNKITKKSNKDNRKTINKVLEIVKMEDFKGHLIGQLSGGQQQRVFIAKALINEPELLLLDEPTKGIDIATQKLFYDIISKLNQELKMTIIIVSHDIGVVAGRINRIACMKDKKIYSSYPNGDGIDEFIKGIYGKDINLINHL